jgi:hypothetical protein
MSRRLTGSLLRASERELQARPDRLATARPAARINAFRAA